MVGGLLLSFVSGHTSAACSGAYHSVRRRLQPFARIHLGVKGMTYSPSRQMQLQQGSHAMTLGEVLSALSYALDVTEGARPGHAVRACLLGTRLGVEVGLSAAELTDLYYALLLKDIGCSGNAARMAEAFRADDQMVKQHFKLVDREKLGKVNRESLSFVWKNVAPDEDTLGRAREVYRMLRTPGDLTAEVIGARCERGASILHKLGLGIDTCAAVYALDEHWNGQGLPDHLHAAEIPLLARICAVAQHLDLFCTEFGSARALETLLQRSGKWYDPEVVQAAESLNRHGGLWKGCLPGDDAARQRADVVALDPDSSAGLADRDVDLVCSGFADVVDAKSPFSYRHSIATAEIASLMSRAMDLSTERVELVRRAALLHDIGMLSVPNTILDKPGRLSPAELAVVHRHPEVGADIVSRVRAFGDVAQLVRQHHERLDGSGYPFGIPGDQLSTEARILAVADVLSAMLGQRSYRPDLHPAEIQRQLAAEMHSRLDPEVVEVGIGVLDQLAVLPLEDIPAMSMEAIPELALVQPPPFRFETA